jgi:hypothetical protein
MFIVLVVGIAAVAVLAASFGDLPQRPFVRSSATKSGAVDSNVANLLRNSVYWDEVLSSSDTREDYDNNVTRLLASGGLERLNSGLPAPIPVDRAQEMLSPPTLFLHTSRNETEIGGTCTRCIDKSWGGAKGTYAPIDGTISSAIDRLRPLLLDGEL